MKTSNIKKEKLGILIALLLLLILSYLAFFYKLGSSTFCWWDETRNAVNALEMSQSRNWLVTTFEGNVDIWNTKPPLLIIMQAICIKVFGISEFAVRFPSAVASSITVLLLFFIVSRYSKSIFLGFLSSFMFITIPGLLPYHAARSADFDAMLLMFSTAYTFTFFAYVETKKIKYLYAFALLFSLTFLTKSSASLIFLVGLFIYTAIRKELINMLKSKHTYICVCVCLLLVGSYYLYREFVTPGYIKLVLHNEFGGRVFSVKEGHVGGFDFYFEHLRNSVLGWWHYFSLLGLILVFFEKNKRLKRLFIFSLILVVSHLLIISSLKTKIEWYCIPECSFFAILAALSIYMGVLSVFKIIEKKKYKIIVKYIVFIGIISIIYFPLAKTISLLKGIDREELGDKNINIFLRDYLPDLIEKDDKVLICPTYPKDFYERHYWADLQYFLFYLEKLQIEGYDIGFNDIREISEFREYYVLYNNVWDNHEYRLEFEYINATINLEVAYEFTYGIVLYKVKSMKEHDETLSFIRNNILLSELTETQAEQMDEQGINTKVDSLYHIVTNKMAIY
jgi:4-amino-4-deoxy-L-arabinose transferase-like glycosyltransferase